MPKVRVFTEPTEEYKLIRICGYSEATKIAIPGYFFMAEDELIIPRHDDHIVALNKLYRCMVLSGTFHSTVNLIIHVEVQYYKAAIGMTVRTCSRYPKLDIALPDLGFL